MKPLTGIWVSKIVELPIPAAETASARVEAAGLFLREDEGNVVVDQVGFGSNAEAVGIDFDWQINSIEIAADRPAKQLMFIPALLVLFGLGWWQIRRREQG